MSAILKFKRKAREAVVGAINFDKYGKVVDYRILLERSMTNGGGGKTPWTLDGSAMMKLQ